MLASKEVEEFRAVAQLRENHCDEGAIDFPDPAKRRDQGKRTTR